MAKYIEVNNDNFESTINEGVTLVDFWAPWCGPCKMVGPIVEELASDYDGKAKVAKINVDNNQELATRFGIRSIPTIAFFKDGELKDQIVGAASKQALSDKIDTLI